MTDLDKHSKDADVYAAMRSAALDFGIDELAAKMHTAIGTLYNKLNRNDSSAHHKPTVSDLIQIVFHTGNTAPIAALCRMFGGVFVRLPDLSATPDDDLLQLINQWGAENGDVYEVMARALAVKNSCIRPAVLEKLVWTTGRLSCSGVSTMKRRLTRLGSR